MRKRFELRRAIDIPIEVITSAWDEPIKLVTGDLTPRGAYVLSELFPEMGDHLVCSFGVPGKKSEYSFFGEVTRVNLLRRRTDHGYPGFGINFLDAGPLDRLCIRSALRNLPPPLPGVARSSRQSKSLGWF